MPACAGNKGGSSYLSHKGAIIRYTVIGGAMVKSTDLGQKEERKGGRIQRDAQSRRTRPDPQQSQGDR
ncbi:uncharacterized protein BDR25DRAFT_352942 [Lindgomyces ingoldianus]|uniref:Uncharacterized protein n=1 Tax=Lindgomyces ingoldianus TaxID=673940 RepID=A0ACB6R010_9PLEO|nr:uncharacterized protein BDR25DRAFT_352942 [Lindgomyces ingoldianus]KAF2472639.1 hypothetical protein BDR25DRAFT_352942 [Lindgomyces ingoldianus]